jgi:superfamily II DNA or RNA helicase
MDNTSLAHIKANGLFFQGGNSPLKYFQDCLSVSIQYRRAAGYFSSSVFIAADIAKSGFVERGGRIQLICSPRLMPEDIDSIRDGLQMKEVLSNSIKRDISRLLNDNTTISATKILGYLVANGQLDIKISVKNDNSPGIFHTKVGIFEDSLGGRSVFCGSTNETWSGWADYGNSESFLAKSSYDGPESLADVEEIETYFKSLWSDSMPNLNTLPFPEVSRDILIKESERENLSELFSDLKRMQLRTKGINQQGGNRTKTLMEHQIAVLENWNYNNKIGIIDHVTGAGKTITAIAAIKEWVAENRPALILVPSTLLQRQWINEIRNELSIDAIGIGGVLGPRSKWLMSLPDNTRNMKEFGPRVVVAVIGSAVSADFLKRLQVGKHLLIVGDEVHTLGQVQCIGLLEKIAECGAFLGLSATHTRFGDPEGTDRIEALFGRALTPSFSIREAINSGRLVSYDYHIVECHLSESEMSAYVDLTKQIERLFAREATSSFKGFSKSLQMLIFRRSRIIKQAESKSGIAKNILEENYHPGDRWLVYCDDINQMNRVEEGLQGLGLPILKYYDAMAGDKIETLGYFNEKGGVLLAIKCLDEGIDIPSATHALILASSQNPREYIQRRGRVLRSHPESGKTRATIYDLVTLTDQDIPVQKSELARMITFGADADNSLILLELEALMARIFDTTGEWPEYEIEIEDLAEEKVLE